ncbi:MAG: Leucine-tRNA ligase [Candidatus Shapirobacteria bacterium GW2011_GWE2_38_30]|uniref:Leucine--tRNA ligase n=1 Tax=Candidatus Shapirobacteria bacterium GW2011_GWE2_38_30 TaxID=1618490 RepID=A0A0G0JU07_9BACT|nr:MAG: Leucine-tRNA ligase [Candidatus Shapirobacteria bacterium GW2011_GWE2_38_30]
MDFREVESKWQKFWEEHPDLYKAQNVSSREKKYVLVEFPYPSGSGLHIGHTFTFTGGDVYARYLRMKGFEVLFPMGWDAFGLPTENYAIKTKQKPQKITKENTEMYKSQMKKLAFSFDWSREVNTTDPAYYKWTQWIFVQLYKKGLAYKQEMPINWCPSCRIGLANEEVLQSKTGKNVCERCGAEVERRTISQWVVKITDYADRLIEGLEKTDFIDKVKAAQINWIGKSEGARVKFKIKNYDEELEVFTTRPDTLFGATFMVVAPEHLFVKKLKERVGGKKWSEIENYVLESKKKSDLERTDLVKEKTGVWTGLHAINPVSREEIEIWISDFVLGNYGTGAIMAVPAHDQRDWDFAKKFRLPIRPAIYPKNLKNLNKFMSFYWGGDMEDGQEDGATADEFYHVVGTIKPYVEAVGEIWGSGDWNGWEVPRDFDKVLDWIEKKGIGERSTTYHIRDWIFSRQHYWGEPIPMIYCEKCGWQPVDESDLPIVLPEVEAYEPTEDGQSPLAKIEEFVNCKCLVCGGEAKRETDTMPNWAGSDWYFLRYIDPNNDTVIAREEWLKKWMPVDVYIGGDEHNTLHLLYSRFIYQFLWDIGSVPKEIPEPYYKRISHGVILGPDNQRMSKSKGNVIVPETVADKYGVDVLRMYLMFMGPFEGTMAWNEKTLMGVKRFLEKYSKNILKAIDNKQSNVESDSSNKIKLIINKTIKGVSEDIERFSYNTAIAKLMEANNALVDKYNEVSKEDLRSLIKLLAPFAPYTAEELWAYWAKASEGSVHQQQWPEVEEKYLIEDIFRVAVAVNGKVRSEIEVSSEDENDEQKVLLLAREDEKMKSWLVGKEIVREIYVKGKMVNLVVK